MLANHRVNTGRLLVHEDVLDGGVKDAVLGAFRTWKMSASLLVLTVLKAVDEVPVMLNVCGSGPCPGTSGCALGVMVFIAAGASV